jgi:3-hydroxyisobutyrate dehydrogenase-like beta-hydroxyacid dehydrogenase
LHISFWIIPDKDNYNETVNKYIGSWDNGKADGRQIKGTLAIMAGGTQKDFSRVKPILDVLGGNVVHVGGPGLGHTVKVINQLKDLKLATALAAEAMANLPHLASTHERYEKLVVDGDGELDHSAIHKLLWSQPFISDTPTI